MISLVFLLMKLCRYPVPDMLLLAQIVILCPLFIFCIYMRKWETHDLVPIRPMEGEELPCNETGIKQNKHTAHLASPGSGPQP